MHLPTPQRPSPLFGRSKWCPELTGVHRRIMALSCLERPFTAADPFCSCSGPTPCRRRTDVGVLAGVRPDGATRVHLPNRRRVPAGPAPARIVRPALRRLQTLLRRLPVPAAAQPSTATSVHQPGDLPLPAETRSSPCRMRGTKRTMRWGADTTGWTRWRQSTKRRTQSANSGRQTSNTVVASSSMCCSSGDHRRRPT